MQCSAKLFAVWVHISSALLLPVSIMVCSGPRNSRLSHTSHQGTLGRPAQQLATLIFWSHLLFHSLAPHSLLPWM